MLRHYTAGESHGKCLIGILEGFPSNVIIDTDKINKDLARRQMGYGRGDRMKIEKDKIEFLSGVRGSKTLASPISFKIENKDYENWIPYMNSDKIDKEGRKVTKPRPGHADLVGALKYNFDDVRNVLERSSARSTATRVAIGSICKQLLSNFGIQIYSHVLSIGSAKMEDEAYSIDMVKNADNSEVRCINKDTEKKMIKEIKLAKNQGDSLGGVFEIIITGVPLGLGSYVSWDRKLDARLSFALMSIQAIKGVEFGQGFANAEKRGSLVHDEIFYDDERGYYKKTNRAGGIEGGMSNGENIVIRCAKKPIPTLYTPLKSVDMETKEAFEATVERSDACAVPAASIVGEMVAATIICEEFLKKFNGDSLEEILERWK